MIDASFERLPEEKRTRIIEGALREFASSGYTLASTNRIVETVGISKGSLFHYFKSKDELWLYVADFVFNRIAEIMKTHVSRMPPDLIDRLRLLAEIMLDFYISNPLYYRFFLGALDPGTSALQQKLLSRAGKSLDLSAFFNGIDTSRFRYSPSSTFLLVKWIFSGIKQELFELEGIKTDPGLMKGEFMNRLSDVLKALAEGIYI